MLLKYQNVDYPFLLLTDAPFSGLGCGLHQMQNEKMRVIDHDSRNLNGAKYKYHC